MNSQTRRLLVGLLTAAAIAAPAAAAAAAPSAVDSKAQAAITVGTLILEPTDRGYAGTLTATVKWNGLDGASLRITTAESVAGAWQGMTGGDCFLSAVVPNGPLTHSCDLTPMRAGEVRQVTQSFRVLTATRPYAMSADTANIWAELDGSVVSKVQHYSTIFRSTDGSLAKPRPYIQDTQSNASVALGAEPVAMVRQPDGTLQGRLPVSVTWHGDAAHLGITIYAQLPAGWALLETDPPAFPCGGGCEIPGPYGPQLMQGETTSFDLIIWAPKGTSHGSYGPLTANIDAAWYYDNLVDVSPEDNSATFSATV